MLKPDDPRWSQVHLIRTFAEEQLISETKVSHKAEVSEEGETLKVSPSPPPSVDEGNSELTREPASPSAIAPSSVTSILKSTGKGPNTETE